MCKERFINVLTDFGFKKTFGSDDNKAFLISFLNSLLDIDDPIADISYRNVEKLGIYPTDRTAIYDLYCTTETGAHIIVEMQNGYQRYFMDRSIYYSTFPIQEASKVGDWDFNLPQVYTVAFLNFKMNEFLTDPQFKHVIRLCDVETGKTFYNKLTYIYLELPKFVKDIDEVHDIWEKWLFVIKNMHKLDEFPPRWKEKVFLDFFRMAEIQAFSPEERMAYEISLKNMRDYNNTIRTAVEDAAAKYEEKGRAEGRAEGEREKMVTIARNLKAMGLDAAAIAEATGLDISEIDEL